MKLHLGCGQVYLQGYINIDYPVSHQNVQKVKADLYADVTKLDYPANSIEEIRLHHVFEHFDRPTALALLCRWRQWLVKGGILRIETPDVLASYKLMISPLISYSDKQQVMRHLHGSHEAEWAVHWDGWYKEKYLSTLTKLGYEKLVFNYSKWGLLRNIEVIAFKSSQIITSSQYKILSKNILKTSTVRVNTKNPFEPEGTEKKLLEHWHINWKKMFRIGK